MELKIWCKTFLNIYRYLEKITYAIDKIVLTTGLNMQLEAQVSAKKMIELTERKVKLINLKLFIENTLNNLDKECTKLLMLKYVDNIKSDEIAKLLNISSRTFFRKIKQALSSFEFALKRLGKTSKILFEEYKDEKWIIDLYEKLFLQESLLATKKTAEKTKNLNSPNIINLAYDNYKKLNTITVFS